MGKMKLDRVYAQHPGCSFIQEIVAVFKDESRQTRGLSDRLRASKGRHA